MQHPPDDPNDLVTENEALRQRIAALEAELATYGNQARLSADVSAAPTRDADGQIDGVVSTFYDAAAQRPLDTALREREQQLSNVIESVGGRFWAVDSELRLLLGNTHFHRDAQALAGREIRAGESIWALPVPEGWRESWHDSYQRALAGETFSIERQSAGSTIIYCFMPLRTEEGAIRGATVVGLEITTGALAETAVQETERKLGALFEILPIGISILDAQRSVVYANPALSRILRLDQAALSQRAYQQRQYLHPDGTSMAADEFASARAFREQQPITNVETGVITETGEVYWTNVSAVPVDFPDWRVVVVTTDITKRKQAEQYSNRAAERLEILAEASRLFAEAGSEYDTALSRIARTLVSLMGDGCIIALVSDDGGWLEASHVYDVDPDVQELTRSLIGGRRRIEESSTNARVFQTGQPLLIPIVNLDQIRAAAKPEYALMIERQAPHSLMVVPMRAFGRVISVLTLYRRHSERPSFNADDLSLVQDLADRAALAISNARLYQQVQTELAAREQAQRATELLHAAGQLLARPLELDQILDTLLNVLQQLIPYDSANIMLPDDPNTFRVHYLRGYEAWTDPEHVKALHFDLSQRPPIAAIVETQRSYLIEDTH